MVSTVPRWLCGCALALATASLAGCTRTILGTVASDAPPVPRRAADLLIEPDRFPARYPAAVLDAAVVDGALQDVDGVPASSVVNPPQCAPPPAPQDAAAVRGRDDQDASSLIVTVTRPAAPLRERAGQLAACPSFTAVVGPATSVLTVTVLPAPPVDADGSYAVDQTVTVDGSARRMLTLAAQIDDVRVSATLLREGADTDPDTQTLNTVFTDAVLKVHRVGGR
jgi:hypothetical protein